MRLCSNFKHPHAFARVSLRQYDPIRRTGYLFVAPSCSSSSYTDFRNFRYEFNGRQLKVHYDKFSPSAAPIPLVGVPPLPSSLSQYDALASHLRSLQLESQQPERRQFEHLSQPELDGLSHPQLDPLRRSDLDSLTSSQLEALLIRTNMLSSSRSSNLGSSPPTSTSLTTPSPLHTQSLAPTAVHSLAPTPTHPHSLTSSPHLGFANTSSTGFASLSMPLPLGTEALTTKLPSHSGVAKNVDSLSLKLKTDAKLGSDLHLLSSKNTSRTSSLSSSRSSVSAGSAQAQNYTMTTSGLSRPSFVTSSPLADGASFSQRSSFGVSQSQRPSFSSSTSQRPSFGSTSQRPSFGGGSAQRPTFNASSLLQGPFFDDERDVQGSISQPVSLGTSRANSGSSAGASSLPPVLSRPTSGVDHDTSLTLPPANGGWPSMSSPRPTSPRSATPARPILSSDSSNKSQSVWGASSKVESSQGSPPANAEWLGNTDAVTTVLGSLGMRRSKAQAHKAAEKEKEPSLDPKLTSPSTQKPTSPQKPSQSSSRRQPGPISLPPPSTFTLPMLSPHHPQSPMYHVGYAPSHPGSPLYHPAMNSPVHHPAMSPLHHPSVHPYHHHMHYGVMTPHGLPPITPSMPPFSFQPQQKTNGRTILTERPGSNEGSRHSQATEGRSEAQPPSSPYHHPGHSQVSYLPSHIFSPGIPLSPGIMIPVSPGYPPSVTMVPLTPGGVPLPMTPGVTMTPGAFWPQAPWINPAPGAPVHADDHRHNQGYPQNSGGDYFPPQKELDDKTGYFPPVSSLANEIFKEGSEFHSGARGEEGHSRSSSASAGMVSPTFESTQEEKQIKNDRALGITRTTSVHNDGKGSGTPKRASLTHRPDSDPVIPSLCSNGERQS